jgi:hypothetical protein
MTGVASIKGRIDELGPRLEHAPADWVYCGRRCTMGGWRLPQSPYANPFTAKSFGPDGAVTEYRKYLTGRPDLVERARTELAGRVLCCFCVDLAKCHCTVLAEACDTPGIWPAPVMADCFADARVGAL